MAGRIVRGEPVSEREGERRAVIDAQVLDAREQARRIVEEAEREAAARKARAAAERDAVLADARERGRQEGLAEAGEVMLRARAERRAMIAGAEREVLDLALAIAGHLAEHAATVDPRVVAEVAGRALEAVRGQRALVMRVNPADAETLRAERGRLMERIGGAAELTLREDAAIRRGGCIVESEGATIDARLETQIEMIARVLES